MEEPLIRHADSVKDAAGCVAIYAPHVLASATSFEETAPGEGEMANRIAQTSTTHPWLVAEHGGELIGYAYACRHRERPAYRWSTDVSVYVHEEQRRKGVGNRLYEALFERLRSQGFRMACAGITLPNAGSVALHERFGFAQVGIYRRIGFKAGAWRDVGWWQLELNATGSESPAEPLGPDRS